MQDHPPVAELVLEALNHQGPIAGDDAGGFLLFGQVAGEIGCGPAVQADRCQPGSGVVVAGGTNFAAEPAQRPAEFGGTAQRVALPEGELAGLSEGGGDQDSVVGDVLDLPARRAQGEDVTDPGFVDHLLVEFAHPASAATLVLGADQEDPEHAPVRDGAAGGHGQALGAGPAGQGAGLAVPDNAWT